MAQTTKTQPGQIQSDVNNNDASVKQDREVTPRLKCIITGEARITNRTYLEKKARSAGGDVSLYLNHYISRKPLKLLRMGKTVDETRHALNVSYNEKIDDSRLSNALKLNGKWSKNEA